MLRQQVCGKLDSGKSEERFNDLCCIRAAISRCKRVVIRAAPRSLSKAR
jgi:hypothetical protein